MNEPDVGHDYRAYPKDSLLSGEQMNQESNGGLEETKPKPSFAEVAQQIGSLELQKAERREVLEQHNWPPGRVEEKLNTEFPDLRTAEKVEDLEAKRQAAARRRKPAKSSRRRVAYVSPRDAGPPPHIAKQIRGE